MNKVVCGSVAVESSRRAFRLSQAECNRMVEFGAKWVHYGAVPDEEVFVEFGISSRQFYERLSAVARSKRMELSLSLRRDLLELCRARLQMSSRLGA